MNLYVISLVGQDVFIITSIRNYVLFFLVLPCFVILLLPLVEGLLSD